MESMNELKKDHGVDRQNEVLQLADRSSVVVK